MTTSFHLIEEVPEQLEEAFSAAMELILSGMADFAIMIVGLDIGFL